MQCHNKKAAAKSPEKTLALKLSLSAEKKALVDIIELQHVKDIAATKIHNHDLSESLPDELAARIRRCHVNVQHDRTPFETMRTHIPEPDPKKLDIQLPTALLKEAARAKLVAAQSISSLNPSTVTEVEHDKHNFDPLQLNVIPLPEQRSAAIFKYRNWVSRWIEYACKKRVTWPSKVYSNMHEHVFDGMGKAKASQLMTDWAARDFAQYLQTFEDGIAPPSAITEDVIKHMFAIMATSDAASALTVQMAPVKSIPEEMAQFLQMHRLSIEFQANRLLHEKRRKAKCARNQKRFAFGSSMPVAEFDWLPDENVPPLVSEFPLDLRTGRALFEGIENLGTVRKIVKHLRENPHLKPPSYLMEKFVFNGDEQTRAKGVQETHVPLYKLFSKPF